MGQHQTKRDVPGPRARTVLAGHRSQECCPVGSQERAMIFTDATKECHLQSMLGTGNVRAPSAQLRKCIDSRHYCLHTMDLSLY